MTVSYLSLYWEWIENCMDAEREKGTYCYNVNRRAMQFVNGL